MQTINIYYENINQFQEFVQENNFVNIKSILVQVETNSLKCSDYNKAYPDCVEVDAQKQSILSCIVGFDKDTTINPNNKLSESIPTNEMDMIVDTATVFADQER